MRTMLIAVLLCAGTGAVVAQTSGGDPCALPPMTSTQARLYQKAGDGWDGLRQYMWIRRSILQMDVTATADWVHGLDKARHACLQRTGQQLSQPSQTQATQVAQTPSP